MLIKLIRLYQNYVSPLLGVNCRYVPSCSEYAIIAIKKYGAKRGSVLAIKRLLRCQPLGGYGYDPVP